MGWEKLKFMLTQSSCAGAGTELGERNLCVQKMFRPKKLESKNLSPNQLLFEENFGLKEIWP